MRVFALWCLAPWYVLAGVVYGGVNGALRGVTTGVAAFRLDLQKARDRGRRGAV